MIGEKRLRDGTQTHLGLDGDGRSDAIRKSDIRVISPLGKALPLLPPQVLGFRHSRVSQNLRRRRLASADQRGVQGVGEPRLHAAAAAAAVGCRAQHRNLPASQPRGGGKLEENVLSQSAHRREEPLEQVPPGRW